MLSDNSLSLVIIGVVLRLIFVIVIIVYLASRSLRSSRLSADVVVVGVLVGCKRIAMVLGWSLIVQVGWVVLDLRRVIVKLVVLLGKILVHFGQFFEPFILLFRLLFELILFFLFVLLAFFLWFVFEEAGFLRAVLLRSGATKLLVFIFVTIILSVDIPHACQSILYDVGHACVSWISVAVIMHDFFLRETRIRQLLSASILNWAFYNTRLSLLLAFFFLRIVFARLLANF